MSELLLLTRIVPGGGGGAGGGGAGPGDPSPTPQKRRLWGEPLVMGVSQVLLGTLQVALGGSLLVALGDPVGAQLGTPLATGPVLIVSGATLAATAQGPSKGRARAALGLAVVASIVSFLALGLQGLLVAYGCPSCYNLGPPAQRVLLGIYVLLMTSSAAGAGLSVIGAVAATRARPKRIQPPVVIYQTALPGMGAGPVEATPTSDPAPQ
ncbi:uncharacterized protein LOC113960988 [Neopelma chrysocephalum]|uniref:uncharacterized protein LOC113960988 n=1 Tax=Neopelma chrysocephalum TaxID=114329 RepID=UPI000FCD02CE|nr:uncharacterized protein LOC113960988 [Neopelma chrysocephalum]